MGLKHTDLISQWQREADMGSWTDESGRRYSWDGALSELTLITVSSPGGESLVAPLGSYEKRITGDLLERFIDRGYLQSDAHATRTWGLDMSTSPRRVGLVSIEWPAHGPGRFRCFRISRDLDALVDLIGSTATTDWWAVDVPFGWPAGFGDFVNRHAAGCTALPSVSETSKTPWASLARRRTDNNVIGPHSDGQRGVSGFSVAFDKLGATAAAWAHIEWNLSKRHHLDIDRSGQSDGVRVVEAYPAATWNRWGFPTVRAAMTHDDLTTNLAGTVQAANADEVMNEHEGDALICALVARARALGKTVPPSSDDEPHARSEGWIHLQEDQFQHRELAGS